MGHQGPGVGALSTKKGEWIRRGCQGNTWPRKGWTKQTWSGQVDHRTDGSLETLVILGSAHFTMWKAVLALGEGGVKTFKNIKMKVMWCHVLLQPFHFCLLSVTSHSKSVPSSAVSGYSSWLQLHDWALLFWLLLWLALASTRTCLHLLPLFILRFLTHSPGCHGPYQSQQEPGRHKRR